MKTQIGRPRLFSFEFFPPKSAEGMEKLRATRKQLAQLNPAFFSVTYGAGGSTREGTLSTVLEIRGEGLQGAPHISCIGSTRDGLRAVLDEYRRHEIRHLVALRGDMPSGTMDAGEFRYANELVAFIRQEFGTQFFIKVAAYPEYHPQARSAQDDLLAAPRLERVSGLALPARLRQDQVHDVVRAAVEQTAPQVAVDDVVGR